jgi:hypothetical protein
MVFTEIITRVVGVGVYDSRNFIPETCVFKAMVKDRLVPLHTLGSKIVKVKRSHGTLLGR